jgi:RHS repeat-associated protein
MYLVLFTCARCVSAQTVKVATLTVNGSEQTVGGSWDAANISVSFNGYIEMVNYAQYSTPASLASALAAMFTRDYNGYGLYAKAGANSNTDPNVITFHLVNGQAFTSIDYTLPNTSFSLVPSGFGSTASTLADSGTVTLSITPPGGSPTAISTTRYGDGSTPETIAQGLASAASSNLVTVNANGALLYLTSRQTNSSTDYPFSFKVTHDTTDFPNPSFQIAPLSGSLTGGSTPAAQSTPVSIYCYSVTTGGPGPCNPNASGTSGYQANGNLANVSDSVMGTWSYSYDNLNRLTGSNEIANGPYANPYNCWSYDSFGNRTDQANSSASFSVENGTTCTTSSSTPIQTLASYGSNNQISSLKLANATAAITPTYDGAGNMTFDGTNTYLYDAESRVCAVHGPFGMTGYQYDADGNRIGKGSITSMSCDLTTNGYQAQSDYVLDLGGGQMSEMAVDANGGEVWQHTNVTAGGSLIATYDTTGLHFYLNDALGTRRAQTDGYGVLEQTCQSLPFGDGLNCSLSNVAPTEHHFTGKERDTESGLDYFKYRMYASNMGRWMSPDPSGLTHADLGNPQSLNLYSYVGNSPLTRADLDGLCWKGFQWACNAVQALDNGVHGLGFQTNASVDREQHTANQTLHHDGVQTEGLSRRQVRKAYRLDMALGSVRSEGDDGFTYATRIRPTAAQARAIWEKATGGKVPYDESMGRFYDMAHKTPIADGGSPRDPANLEPMLHSDHMDSHRENGDFARWGARSGTPGEPSDVTIEPTVPIEPPIIIDPIP